ncbi:pyridoxal phosphate-dependent decarboxylase family protein [Streptomyces sp. NPDC050658]|uniref:pyridoxal phosphate-dependent decarboxylase family protein n=1 Tax=unclassified Streptomyces TaxID=2593676 RepID=UPI0034139176
MLDLLREALAAVIDGTEARSGPCPSFEAAELAQRAAAAFEPILPEVGSGTKALPRMARTLAEGAADPAMPWCTGHLHTPPLAVAVAADTVSGLLNASVDSWDQAPCASVIEGQLTEALARMVFPQESAPGAVMTTGGTDSTMTALLLAREHVLTVGDGPPQVVCGANAHHSVARAAWMLGLRPPVVVRCVRGRLDISHLAEVLKSLKSAVVVATAGTTDAGSLDALREVAELTRSHSAWLHVDAAYGGPALFSDDLKGRLSGVEQADTVSFDLHKFGWQPLAAGVLAARKATLFDPLAIRAEYLNADDDTAAGLPDLLRRSWRTSRPADAFKVAVTLQALGRKGMAALVEQCCHTATEVAEYVERHPTLRLWEQPELSTVLFRPRACDRPGVDGDQVLAALRRQLLTGTAVLGRARMPDRDGRERIWLKLTILNPHTTLADYKELFDLVATSASEQARSVGSPSSRGATNDD